MKRPIRAAAVQFEHTAGDKKANFRKIDDFLLLAYEKRVDVIVFPECCITGYWFLRHLSREALLELAEPVFDGDSSRALAERAREYGMIIGAGLIEIDRGEERGAGGPHAGEGNAGGNRSGEGTLYNTFVVALPGGKAYRHRKLHAFVSPHLTSGSEYTVFDTRLATRMGVLTCYDNNICENVRMTALKGAEVILAPHQTGGCGSTNPHTMGLVDRRLWENREKDPGAIEEELRGPRGRGWLMRWLPTRAHDNGVFLVFSNGVGVDDDEIRTGNAMIIDPYGRIVAETWKAGDDMVVADLDPSLLVENTGQRWIRTRRPELYGPLALRTGLEQDTRAVRFDEKGV
jgi:predicted amidohydrolase